VAGLVIICVWIAPICPTLVDRINLQTQNSPNLEVASFNNHSVSCALDTLLMGVAVAPASVQISINPPPNRDRVRGRE